MITAAIFATTDPAARSSLLVAGSREMIALNTPASGCWREAPAGCASAADVPALGELPALAEPSTQSTPLIPANAGTQIV